MKTIVKSASMVTLCELYADLIWLRNEVKKLERAMIRAPRVGETHQQNNPQARSVREELH